MQKKLEADLISIAHKILQIKNKSDINQLYFETQKLYEKLAVLRFVEEHFGEPKPTIGQTEVVEKMNDFFENPVVSEFQKPDTIIEPISDGIPITEEIIVDKIEDIIEDPVEDSIEIESVKEEIIDIESEEIASPESTSEPIEILEEPEIIVAEIIENPTPIEEPIVAEKMAFEPIVEDIEPIVPEIPKKKEAVQISFDDLLGANYMDPQFIKVIPSDKKQLSEPIQVESAFEFQPESIATTSQNTFEKEEAKSVTLNDKLVKEISVGLNDRIAFVKHLFGGSNEDYNRVLNQLITLDTYTETKNFIDEMVKPDYNNWEGKEEYEHRFMEIIEKKFLSF